MAAKFAFRAGTRSSRESSTPAVSPVARGFIGRFADTHRAVLASVACPRAFSANLKSRFTFLQDQLLYLEQHPSRLRRRLPMKSVVAFSVGCHEFLLALRESDKRLYVERYGPGDWHESRVSRVFAAQC